MIGVSKIRAMWLARYKVDFRKGHWSLLAEAYGLGLDPLQGDLILFVSRDKRKLKLLYIDGTGIWLSHKLFFNASMKSIVDFQDGPCKASITSAELGMLLEGTSFTVHKRIPDFTVKG
jgi:hypothetical protein